MNEKKLIAAKIKKIRENLNMSQDRFGKKIGLTGKSISAYETGKSTPPLKVLEKISSVYDAGFTTISSDYTKSIIAKIRTVKHILNELEERIFG